MVSTLSCTCPDRMSAADAGGNEIRSLASTCRAAADNRAAAAPGCAGCVAVTRQLPRDLLSRTSTVVPPLTTRPPLIVYTRHGTSTLAESLRIPPYCASITSTTDRVPAGRSSFTTAATATRLASGWISPDPGVHARTEGSATVGVEAGALGVRDGLGAVGVPDASTLGVLGVPAGLEATGPLSADEPLHPASNPAPATSSPRRPATYDSYSQSRPSSAARSDCDRVTA